MTRKLHTLVILAFLLVPQLVFSQKSLKKANKQFELKAYELAIANYMKVLNEEEPGNLECIYKIAEAYRLTNQPIDAIGWYRKISNLGKIKPEYFLNYAHVLKSVGKYSDAQRMYLEYKNTDPEVGEHFAASCDFAAGLLKTAEKYDLNLFGANTRYSDFGVTFHNGKAVFNTFAYKTKSDLDQVESEISTPGNKLVYAQEFRPKFQDNIQALFNSEDVNKRFIGPVCYSDDAKIVAYTKNRFVDGHSFVTDGDVDLSIFLADAEFNGSFSEGVPFKHNELGYSTGFPCLAFNGTALYFASNRPGGYGGFDLYVSYYKNDEWSYPTNLGPKVNSTGNEITPYFDDQNLYFSSDYHHGLGGFDIFKAEVVNGDWDYPINLGKTINSPSDDYFFVINKETKDMYFSSNRIGGRGKDDIYIVKALEDEDLVIAPTENLFVPKAVSLKDLAETNTTTTNPLVATVSLNEEELEVKEDVEILEDAEMEIPEALNLKDLLKANTSVKVDLKDARKVAFGEIIKSSPRVYFVQVAAYSRSINDMYRFKSLVQFGNIYKIHKSNSTKVRLGYYLDESEARDVLNQVKRNGFSDAFITKESLNTSEMELAFSSAEMNQGDFRDSYDNYANNVSGTYKVRLASYEDPIWFDVGKVKDIGSIEQWTKGAWTIFVLSGYSNLTEAESAKRKAINRGFSDATVVIDKGGYLEKLGSN